MTDPNRSANELPALLEERRKFEGWLTALEARRESTPPHVFDRVRTDYQSRMRQVEDRLAAHRQSIQDERTSLESRRSLLEAEEQLRRDERAELELRAHVGELAEADSAAAFRAVDEALAEMSVEKESLTKRITELDALLGLKAETRPAAAQPESPAPAVEAQTSEPAPLEIEKEEDAAPVDASASEQTIGKDPLHTPGGSFDELAFLTDVVGLDEAKGKSGIIREEQPAASILDGIAGSRDRGALASNVGNTPIVLRSSSVGEPAKTLKCTECGAMNYPTEWYCERCGAELAAL
jgi:hypothetical protein